MNVGDRIQAPPATGAVGFERLEDLEQGLLVLGMSMNPLVPDQPYEVVEIKGGSARLRYAGDKAAAEAAIRSGPYAGGYGHVG